MEIEVDESQYKYGGLSSWVVSLFLIRPNNSLDLLSEWGRLTALGSDRIGIGPPREGKILLRLEAGEKIRVVRGHRDLGEHGQMTSYEIES